MNKLKSTIIRGSLLFFSLTSSYVYAMEPEKDRCLYTKIMKQVVDPAHEFNLEYLKTLPRILTKKDLINYKKLFSKPKNPMNKISGIGLAILAADEERVREFLKKESEANFNYSEEKKRELAHYEQKFNPCLDEKQFIKKHLYTSKHLNPNDPLLYTFWGPTSNGPEVYSLVHLAANPYVGKYTPRNRIPNYLPQMLDLDSLNPSAGLSLYKDFETWEQESKDLRQKRLNVIDALAESGAHFDCVPSKYLEIFLNRNEPIFSRNLTIVARDDFKCSNQQSLIARTLFYGVELNLKSFSSQGYVSSDDQKKFEKNFLTTSLDQLLNENIGTKSICPTEYVRTALKEIKEEELKNTIKNIKNIKEKLAEVKKINENYIIDEEVREMMYWPSSKDGLKEDLKILSHKKTLLENINF